MTLRRRFVYRQRSRESVDRHLRRHQRAGAIRLAYHGEPEKLCALLRADGQGDLAALIARGEFTKRNAPADKRTEVKQYICALVRSDEKRVKARYGKLPWGTRSKLINKYMGLLAEAGELDYNNRDPQGNYRPDDEIWYERGELPAEIRKDLERGEKPKTLAKSPPRNMKTAGRKNLRRRA
jgi:hypothetical protein